MTTKAAVKEIANIPLNPSTKTMLAVLKSTKIRSKPGRKKKGKSSGNSKVVEQQKNSKSKHKKNTTGTGNTTPHEFENQYSPGSGSCLSGHSSKSPAFSPRSVASSENLDEHDLTNKKAGNSKSRTSTSGSSVGLKKALIELGWRSKHKNVIDPVFLAELEHLIQVCIFVIF